MKTFMLRCGQVPNPAPAVLVYMKAWLIVETQNLVSLQLPLYQVIVLYRFLYKYSLLIINQIQQNPSDSLSCSYQFPTHRCF